MKNQETLIDLRTGARFYSVREAARVLGYHPFSVYRLICTGRLRHTRLGPKKILLSRQDLLHYQRRSKEEAPRRGSPLEAETAPSPQAEVVVDLAKGQFRWESVPLIRARLGARGRKSLSGLRISVRGREGDAWRTVYEAPRGTAR